jgi:glycosyltransferase involved in cell wall biosynthesis
MSREGQFLLSLVVPAFNEEANLERFHAAVSEVVESIPGCRVELVFVDDGSRDGTFDVLTALAARDPRVRAIRFPRNFGSHVAIAAGLDNCQGDCATIIAADLQDTPATIRELVARWREGYDVVWAARRAREDSASRRLTMGLFYGLVRRHAIPGYPKGGTGSFCLIDRKVVRTFVACKERNRLTFGLIAWSGFRHAEVPYERVRRTAGQSGWSKSRMLKSALDTFISFSTLPIRTISLAGLAISAVSFVFALYVLFSWALWGTQVGGWTSVMFGVLFLGGVQLMMIGLLGEYLARVLDEVHGRPLYVVERQIGLPGLVPGSGPVPGADWAPGELPARSREVVG